LELETTPEFDRDLKRQAKRKGSRIRKLGVVIHSLRNHIPLPGSHRDHSLKGRWAGYQECHVGGEGDWLLVYIIVPGDPGKLILFRTGKHEEIFR
jgi:mRNA interferase YafQ